MTRKFILSNIGVVIIGVFVFFLNSNCVSEYKKYFFAGLIFSILPLTIYMIFSNKIGHKFINFDSFNNVKEEIPIQSLYFLGVIILFYGSLIYIMILIGVYGLLFFTLEKTLNRDAKIMSKVHLAFSLYPMMLFLSLSCFVPLVNSFGGSEKEVEIKEYKIEKNVLNGRTDYFCKVLNDGKNKMEFKIRSEKDIEMGTVIKVKKGSLGLVKNVRVDEKR